MKKLILNRLINNGIRLALAMVCGLLTLQAFARSEFKPKSMEPKPFDTSASVYGRTDLNGNSCALVKVILLIPEIGFEGNVIGESEFKKGEYWVYLTPGTKRLKLKHDKYMPIMVEFSEFGINSLEGKTTYELMVEVITDDPIEAKKLQAYAAEIETLKATIEQMSETDDHKFQRAKETRNITLMQQLAEGGYEKSYLKLAEMYSDKDNLDEAEKWALKAIHVKSDTMLAKFLLRNIKEQREKLEKERNSLTNRKKAIIEGLI